MCGISIAPSRETGTLPCPATSAQRIRNGGVNAGEARIGALVYACLCHARRFATQYTHVRGSSAHIGGRETLLANNAELSDKCVCLSVRQACIGACELSANRRQAPATSRPNHRSQRDTDRSAFDSTNDWSLHRVEANASESYLWRVGPVCRLAAFVASVNRRFESTPDLGSASRLWVTINCRPDGLRTAGIRSCGGSGAIAALGPLHAVAVLKAPSSDSPCASFQNRECQRAVQPPHSCYPLS